MPKVKSKKTYSLMIEYEGKVYYLRSIDWGGYHYDNGKGYDSRIEKHIFRLTDKTSSAKKWKSKERLFKSVLINSVGLFEFRIGREELPLQTKGVWHNILNPTYQKCVKQQSDIIKNLTHSVNLIDDATRLIEITKIIHKYEGLLNENCKTIFEIIDSSHNFRKIKLEQINKLFENK